MRLHTPHGLARPPPAVTHPSRAAAAAGASRQCCCRCTRSRSHRLPVVATSEHWYEDEQEYDAVTEVLLPKRLVLCTPAACRAQLQQLREQGFVAAFTSPSLAGEAQQVWQQLDRAGPPLFLKVRQRRELQALEDKDAAGAAAAAAEAFLGELTSQSWRLDLDYGLNKAATLQAATEPLLAVLSRAGVGRLRAAVKAAATSAGSSSTPGEKEELCVVSFEGWNSGERGANLERWQQLAPTLSNELPAAAGAAVKP